MLGTLGLCLTAGACKEEPAPTPKLFEEAGTWSVIRYDLEGTGELTDINENNRENAFMLSFDPMESVVTGASCVEPGSGITPSNSPCLISPNTTEWQCRCFAYDFVRDQMLWREFNVGDPPPEVSLDPNNEPMGGSGGGSGGEGGGEGDGGVGEDVMISVFEIEGISATFNFLPLPLDLFASNGENSRYILQARAPSIFDIVYEDPERPPCSPCVP